MTQRSDAVPEFGESGHNTKTFNARCLHYGDHLVLVMSVDAWAALLDAMCEVRGVNANLDAFYTGLKCGFGFETPEEAMRAKAPGVES